MKWRNVAGSDYIDILKKIDLFQYFSTEELHAFSEAVEEIHLAQGQLLFREGDPGNEMYILISGLLKIFRGNRFINLTKPGGYIGEMAIIEKQPRSASVEAMESSVLLKIPYSLFQEYLAGQPQSLVAMMKSLSQRIRHDTEVLAHECEQINIMVHDMKNLLTPFHLLELMERKMPELAGHKYVNCMIQSRENLLALMEKALVHAKNIQSTTPVVTGSIEELLAELIESDCAVHPDIGGRGITVRLEGSLPRFPFSGLGLRRVLVNLMVNAAQASASGAEIVVRLVHDGDVAMIEIIDHGEGIPLELQERVFLPHFTTKEKGHGLGLVSCRQIIEESHRGSLFFASEPAKGTTFSIRLPISPQIG